jgi:hypothetical protein
LRCKGKTLLGVVNKLFGQNIAGCCQQTFKKFVDNAQQCFAFIPFPPLIRIFTEGDGIESRLSSLIFFTLIDFDFLCLDEKKINRICMRAGSRFAREPEVDLRAQFFSSKHIK